jgi:hypothetical protein
MALRQTLEPLQHYWLRITNMKTLGIGSGIPKLGEDRVRWHIASELHLKENTPLMEKSNFCREVALK